MASPVKLNKGADHEVSDGEFADSPPTTVVFDGVNDMYPVVPVEPL